MQASIERSRLTCPPIFSLSPSSRLAAVMATAAILLRLVTLARVDGTHRVMDPNGDSAGYLELAQGLRHGCGFALLTDGRCSPPPGSLKVRAAQRSVRVDLFPEIDRTPGYPVFLSLMPDLRVALVVQVLLSGVMIFAICAFVSANWGLGAGLVSSALIALDPPSILYSVEVMSETIFTFAFVLGVLSALHACAARNSGLRKLSLVILSSILFGGAILVRPIGQLAVLGAAMIPFAFGGVPRLNRSGFVALALLIPAVAIVGWSLRNYRLTGIAYFSPVGAVNFFYHRAGGTLVYAGNGSEADLIRSEDELQPDQTGLTRQALNIIADHPAAFARMTAWSFVYLCVVPDRSVLEQVLGIARAPSARSGSMRASAALSALYASPITALRFLYKSEFDSCPTLLALVIFQLLLSLLLWIGVILGLNYARVNRFSAPDSYKGLCIILCAAVALWLLLLAAGPEAADRYRIPAIPLLAIVSGIGWSSLNVTKRRYRFAHP